MALKDFLKPHRSWEDGLGLLLGVMIGLTPWLYEEASVPAVLLNSAMVGLSVLVLAQLEIVHLRRWHEIAQLVCGLWLVASPFIFDYAHQDHLQIWHWVLGGVVCTLAVFELWQNRGAAGQGG
jgi:SPW repeat